MDDMMSVMDEKCCLKVGDQVYCENRKLRGFVTRLNALGLNKYKTIGVHWENGKRDTLFGDGQCCTLKKDCCDEEGHEGHH